MFRHLWKVVRLGCRVVVRVGIIVVAIELILRVGGWWNGGDLPLQADPNVGWRFKPHLQRVLDGDEGPWLLETNSLGFRSDEPELANREGELCIVGLGNSTSLADGLDESEGYFSLLEELVPRARVVNLSGVGYTADQDFRVLIEHGLACRPDVVVQLIANTDLDETFAAWSPLLGSKCYLEYEDGALSIQPPRRAPWIRPVESSKLVRTMLYTIFFVEHMPFRMALVSRIHELGMVQRLDPVERCVPLAKLWLMTQHVCHQHGSDYVAVYLPNRADIEREQEWEGDWVPLVARVVRRIQAEQRIPILDLTQVMREAMHDPRQPPPFDDKGYHINAHGHRLLAEQLATFLRQRAAVRAADSANGINQHDDGAQESDTPAGSN